MNVHPSAATGVPPIFIGDHPALDFLNTAFGTGSARQECLSDDQAVIDWLVSAGLVQKLPEPPALKLRGTLLETALALRESARELLEKRKAGKTGDPTLLNELLSLGASYSQLIWKKGQEPKREQHRQCDDVRVLLVSLAEAFAELLVDENLDLVRRCQNPDCTLWFYDRTKSHRRRWCSMALCGNRMKVAAFRERQRAD